MEEFIKRRKEERDRKYGQNKFAPQAGIFQFQPEGPGSAPLSMEGVVNSATANESTLRVLGPELCDALRTLKIDIPELYCNQASWQINLLVMKIELRQALPVAQDLKRKKRQS